MNEVNFVKVEFDKTGSSAVKIKATRSEIVLAVSSLVGDCVEHNLLPDVKEHIIPVGAKIGSAVATGINSTTLSLGSMKNVYNDLIEVLITQLIEIEKTMKGEN